MESGFNEWLRSRVEQINREMWRSTYVRLPDGTIKDTDTGNIYRAHDGTLLSSGARDVLDAEIILEDVLDADELSF